MSLESAIADLVSALNANTAALLKSSAPAPVVETEKKTRKTKTEEVAPVTASVTANAPITANAPATPAVAPAPTAAAPTYPGVKEVISAAQAILDANGQEDFGWPGHETVEKRLLRGLAESYGAAKLSQVPEDKRAEVIAKLGVELANLKKHKEAQAATSAI